MAVKSRVCNRDFKLQVVGKVEAGKSQQGYGTE
jgi:hypothetical protein